MIAEAIDRVVSAFSPSSALKRKQARYALQSVERGIEAGKQSRIHANTPTNRSPDSLFLTHGRLTRANSRDLVLNNAYAKGAIRAIVRNVVGTGIKPQARTDNDAFNNAMEELFAQQSPFCDVTGEISFFEKQALVLSEALTAGDSLEHFVEIEDDPNRPVPLALETIDVDRLADDEFSMRRLTKDMPNGEYVKLGIHYDRLGRKLGYFVKNHHPNDILGWNEKIEYRSSKEMLHTYRKERASQNRGLPILTPVVWWLKNLGYLVEAEVVYRNVAACQGVYIKTFDGGDSGGLFPDSGTDTSDNNGNTNLFLEPGAVTRLLPGEEVGMIDFKRNSTESEIFVNLLIRTIAVGCGVSFERLARDYSKTNFSSNRAGDLEDRREFRPMQNWLVNSLCKPYWNRLLWYGVANRLPGFPSPVEYVFNPAFYEKCEWIAPGWEWVDPKNQATAEQIGLETGITNIFDIWLSQGKDPEEQIEKLRKQNELKTELGLTFSKEQPQEQEADNGEEE